MIPELGDEGHLPPGRYRTTLEEIQARFVDHEQFQRSATRADVWSGFGRYMWAWKEVTDRLSCPQMMRWLWIGGSFTSAKLDPSDLDITPIIDNELLETLTARPGVRHLRDLFRERKKMRGLYRVEPMPIGWRAIASTYTVSEWGSSDRDYLERRGAMDDWWQRVQGLDSAGAAPVAEDAPPRRGYLEVEL